VIDDLLLKVMQRRFVCSEISSLFK